MGAQSDFYTRVGELTLVVPGVTLGPREARVLRIGAESLRGSPAVIGELVRDMFARWVRPDKYDSDVILMDESELESMQETIEVLSDEDLTEMVRQGVDSNELCDAEEFHAAIGAELGPVTLLEPIRATWNEEIPASRASWYDDLVDLQQLALRPPIPPTTPQELVRLASTLGLQPREGWWQQVLTRVRGHRETPQSRAWRLAVLRAEQDELAQLHNRATDLMWDRQRMADYFRGHPSSMRRTPLFTGTQTAESELLSAMAEVLRELSAERRPLVKPVITRPRRAESELEITTGSRVLPAQSDKPQDPRPHARRVIPRRDGPPRSRTGSPWTDLHEEE